MLRSKKTWMLGLLVTLCILLGQTVWAQSQNVTVQYGIQITNPPPVVLLSPASLAFGNQQEDTTSSLQGITLQNTGNGPLNISTIIASTQYAETNNCPTTLTTNQSCTIDVTFTPTVIGSVPGILTITDNAPVTIQTVSLSGTGIGATGASSVGFTKLAAATTIQGNGFNDCPPNNFGGTTYAFSTKCGGIFPAWTSFGLDVAGPNGPRMISAANGGHTDYLGNEVYEMNPITGTSVRLNNPSTTFATSCANADASAPGAGHTYGFNFVDPATEKLYIGPRITGDTNGDGCAAFQIWSLDLTTVNQACAPTCTASWTQVNPVGYPASEEIVAAYVGVDTSTGLKWVWEPFNNAGEASVSKWDTIGNTWTKVVSLSTNATLYSGVAVDVQNQALIIMGSCSSGAGCTADAPTSGNPAGNFWCDLSTGCPTLFHPPLDPSCATPGEDTAPSLVYNTTRQQVMAFVGDITWQSYYVVTVNKSLGATQGAITCAQEVFGTVQGTSYPEKFNFDNGDTTPMFNKVAYDEPDNSYVICANVDTTCWTLKQSPVVRVVNTSASTITNTPVMVSEGFHQGDIPNFTQAMLGPSCTNGTLLTTQADVRQRWPDSSMKLGMTSFILPTLGANGTQVVCLLNQSTGNNTGFLTQSQMLASGFNFDEQIQLTGTVSPTISAKTMLTNCSSIATTTDPSGSQNQCRYWLQGPIVTAVILDDRSVARIYDVSTDNSAGKPLHPIIEAYFFPQNNNVETVASIEDDWASSTVSKSMRNQTYSLKLLGGSTSPTTLFTRASFTHIGNSSWSKDYCIVGALAGTINGCQPIVVDHNAPYEAYARIIPNYDHSLVLPASQIAGEVAGWTGGNQDIIETVTGCDGSGGIGYECLDGDTGGTSPWFGYLATNEMYYWFTRWNSGELAAMNAAMLGNSLVASRLPFQYMEADTTVGSTTLWYDNAASVSPIGRSVSINARPKQNYMIAGASGSNFNSNCSGDNNLTLNLGSITDGGWGNGDGSGGMDASHWYQMFFTAALTSGKFRFIELAQKAGAYMIALDKGCSNAETGNPGPWRDGTVGFMYAEQPGRGSAWLTRTAAQAYAVSVDGSPEQAYFSDKLQNTAIVWEGVYGLSNTDTTRSAAYSFGTTNQNALSSNALHIFLDLGCEFVESPLDTTGSCASGSHLLSASSPWEWGYQLSVMAQLRDWGFGGWTSIMSWQAKEWVHAALDSTFGNQYMIGTYRIPTTLGSTNTWVQNGSDWLGGFTQGNGSGLSTSWTDDTHSQKPCDYSADDDHWHAAPEAVLGFLYPYSDSGLLVRVAYDKLRVSLYATGGCMPGMFNNPTLYTNPSPKWDILPRRTQQ